MGRSILAVVAGALLAFILIYLVEAIGHVVYPIPSDLDLNNPAAISSYVKTAPIGALLFVLAAWAVGTFFGALSMYLINWGDNFVLRSFVSFESIGVYNLGYQIFKGLILLVGFVSG